MTRIAVISPYKQFARYAEDIARGMKEVELYVCYGYFSEGLEYARLAEEEGCDAIICRGLTYAAIKSRSQIPVLNASETVYDLLKALRPVKGSGKSVNVFVYGSGFVFWDDSFTGILEDLFGVRLCITRYGSQEELERLFFEQLDRSDVFAGGSYLHGMCAKYNKQGLLLETSRDTLGDCVRQAVQLVKARRTLLHQKNQIATILDCTYEGVLYVGRDGAISMINRMARDILGFVPDEEVVGRAVGNKAWRNKIDSVIRSGQSLHQDFQEVGDGVQIVESIIPVITQGEVEGVVLSFKESNQLMQMETELRVGRSRKGSVARYHVGDIIGVGPAIRQACDLVQRFGNFDSSVLIQGETGTGKEMFSQSIHNASVRRAEPFYAINCATMPESLLESELFGYSEGAFTGAKKGGKPGLFELAHNGTLYFDEIAEMPLSFQSKLLRILQEHEVRRIGDDKVFYVNVRIISASHTDLFDEVQAGRFREDLYYRLNVMYLHVPPLRERPEDIPLLLRHFLRVTRERLQFPVQFVFSDEAMDFLRRYPWRGNVRELQNFVERVYVYHTQGDVLELEHIRPLLHRHAAVAPASGSSPEPASALPPNLKALTDQAIRDALARFDGNKTRAAAHLGISRSSLWRWCKSHDL